MIRPYPTQDVLSEPAPLRIPFHARLLCGMFRRGVRRLRLSIRARRERSVSDVLARVKECADRGELERLIGKPRQIVRGHRQRIDDPNSPSIVPDIVESYQFKGIRVELWFKDDELASILAWVDVTAWDVLCGCGCPASELGGTP